MWNPRRLAVFALVPIALLGCYYNFRSQKGCCDALLDEIPNRDHDEESGNANTSPRAPILLQDLKNYASSNTSEPHWNFIFEREEVGIVIPPSFLINAKKQLQKFLHFQMTSNSTKTLLVKPSNGLGNRQLTEASALILAMATKRKLVFNSEETYYTNSWHSKTLVDLGNQNVAHLSVKFGINGLKLLVCTDFSSYDEDIMVLSGLVGFPALFNNPFLYPFISQNFGRYLFYFTHNFLHQPSSRILDEVETFWKNSFQGVEYVLGVQARISNSSDMYVKDYSATFTKFVHCAQMLLNKKSNWKIFVTSDNDTFISSLANEFPGNVVFTVTHKTPDGDQERAYLDQLLLSLSDDIILTELSTFGFGAAASSLITPYFVGRNAASCFRARHSQQGILIRKPSHPFWRWQESTFNEVGCTDRSIFKENLEVFG